MTAILRAQQLFEKNVSRNAWQVLFQSLPGSNQELRTMPELNSVDSYVDVVSESQVDPKRITGSFNAGRTRDFDGNFRPKHERLADRWISVAKAYLRGRSLPPVKLVEIGDSYFVLDGHHRISVARALGQEKIKAIVVSKFLRRAYLPR